MVKRSVITTEVSDDHIHNERAKAVTCVMSAEFIYWVLGIIEGLLALRFFFRLAGASTAAGFTRFVYNLTAIFMVPFRLIFPTSVAEGAVFEWSILVAMAVYALIAWMIIKLIAIFYTAEQAD